MWIYKPDNEKHNFDVREWKEGEEIPEGWTEKEPPETAYKIVYDWETEQWIETATSEEIETMIADPAYQKRERQEKARQDVFELMMNSFIKEQDLTDEQIDAVLDLYEEYMVGKQYKPGDLFRHEGTVYQVVQTHTSQADWTPSLTPALYKVFKQKQLPDGTPIVAEWKQPTGAQDSYQKGARVTYQGKTWESTADNNVWAPGVYGWKQI